ncbi:DNA adenine methylase [Synechocystis sp. LKSZ1]|uniref:DNA adenine methylase n=1 Tax=Synechocystis sp. LKSZ1 TaxID=3144951 RepID=UPI00336C175E
MNPVKADFANVPKAKPFLKWAGGKSQLLSQFHNLYPLALKEHKLNRYVEPFVGGGAVFFDVMQTYKIESAFLYDINWDLIIAYNVVKSNVEDLISVLQGIAEDYLQRSELERKEFYYALRQRYNQNKQALDHHCYSGQWLQQTALLLFLNRTCFNGLFRLNHQGEFNVPHGRYKNPKILDAQNLLAVAQLLKNVEIKWGDFEVCAQHINSNTFVYFDPPYRPLNRTANFTTYSTFTFNDQQQHRLSLFFRHLDQSSGAKLMLSNSDPHNENSDDDFFEILYQDYRIYRVQAHRMINSNAQKRGFIKELVIVNY